MLYEEEASGGESLFVMGPETSRHPQPFYRRLREAAPVVRAGDGSAVVTRRCAVNEVFRHPEAYSSNAAAADLKTPRPLIPLQIDPPDHRKYRKVLDPLFAPQRMKRLEEPVARLVNEHIDRFAGQREIDFAQQFSVPFPSQVFLTLLGLPLEDLPRFLAMKDGIIRAHHILGKPLDHPDVAEHRAASARAIYEYYDTVLEERASDDRRRDDLLTQLLDAEVDGVRLSREEVLDTCFLFLTAGLDTVSASLDCFFGYLAEHPEQRRPLVERPSMIPQVVEELLRWETPVIAVSRVATRDTELAGCPVSAGQRVSVVLGSANTDEDEFPDADEVRWDREENRHLAFGGGIHRCLGSHLARLELRVALREWHARIPDYHVKPGAQLAYTPGIRALETFPMVLGA
jgi:cytochrome P450